MINNNFMTIDDIPILIEGEKNILELIRKAGIELPTFCYHSELSIYGACRMCMIEDENGNLDTACSAQPRAGMVIRTNTKKLQKHRKMILELILSNHCRDCTICPSSQICKLRDLASRFHMEDIRFPTNSLVDKIDTSSPCITKNIAKCILCGDCVRVCNEVQNVGAIDFVNRGSKMIISTAFEEPLAQSDCVGCGQCVAACPTGAIIIKNDSQKLWEELFDPDTKVSVQIAPAVRVAIGRDLGLGEHSKNVFGQIVAALRRIGFDEIFDTATGADLTVIEESAEFVEKLKSGDSKYPLFTSCCPAWVNYCEKKYPELLPYLSSCKSPMEMLASVVKEYHKANSQGKLVHVAVMPCTAKKFEAKREEFVVDGVPVVDYVITTRELIKMIRESVYVFSELEAEATNDPFEIATGAGVIFGATGGVTEAVLRSVSADKSLKGVRTIVMHGVRGMDGLKEATVMVGDREAKIAIVSGLGNASKLIERIKAGEHYDFVEVMACPNGCVNGAGQPLSTEIESADRAKSLYITDKLMSIKHSEQNSLTDALYNGVLKDRVHELLHVHYNSEISGE